MRAAVVGHLEWVEFLPVERLPRQGEILETTSSFEEPAGGGAVAAVQLARLAGERTFFTGGCDHQKRMREEERRGEELRGEFGVPVRACLRQGKPTRRAFVYLDDDGERTITPIGERLGPARDHDLPCDELADAHCVYFVAGDEEALLAAREARPVVATSRVIALLEPAGLQ